MKVVYTVSHNPYEPEKLRVLREGRDGVKGMLREGARVLGMGWLSRVVVFVATAVVYEAITKRDDGRYEVTFNFPLLNTNINTNTKQEGLQDSNK